MQMRVIIVDDDSTLLNTASDILSKAGATFVCAPEEYAVSVALSSRASSHVILDPLNGNVNGLDLINRLAALPIHPALILVSEGNFRLLEATKQAALNKGLRIVSVARKPVSREELAALLENTRDASADRPTLHSTLAPIAANDIESAIKHDQFEYFYQPRIDCRTNMLVGFEALARWKSIPPRDFIAAAESSGLMRILMRKLAARGISWLGTNFPRSRCTLSINLSTASISDIGAPEYLAMLCRHFHLDTPRIILEVAEPAIEDDGTALEQITRFRLKGFHVALANAGTGYSAFEHLRKLPFSELEIDRTFVRRLAVSEECREIVEAMILMGHRLELTVIGKGVESQDSLAYLAEHGCDYAQGYFIAPPLESRMAAEWRPR